MQGDVSIINLVFLGIIAFILIRRLHSVLGTRPENDREERSFPSENKKPFKSSETVINLDEYTLRSETAAEPGKPFESLTDVEKGYLVIQEKDPSFDPKEFIENAKSAFELIVTAYALGDVPTLKNLLEPGIFKAFSAEIDRRKTAGEKAEVSLIGFKETKTTAVEKEGSTALITVEFKSEQTNVIKDGEGKVIVGDPTLIDLVTDVWQFSKNMNSSDPTWFLAATKKSNA